MKLKKLTTTLALTLALMMPSLYAQKLNDIEGMRASSAENELRDRGFKHIKSDKSRDGIYAYWWKKQNKKCVTVRIVDGRVRNVTKTLPADCGKNSNGKNNHNNYSSYSNYNNRNNHDDYDRGFQDALHNRRYNAYGSSQAKREYNSGWGEGIIERRERGNNYDDDYNRSNGDQIKIRDLEHKDASYAYREIRNRGYRKIEEFRNDGKLVKVWWNDNRRVCRKTAERGGKIVNVAESTKCKMK